MRADHLTGTWLLPYQLWQPPEWKPRTAQTLHLIILQTNTSMVIAIRLHCVRSRGHAMSCHVTPLLPFHWDLGPELRDLYHRHADEHASTLWHCASDPKISRYATFFQKHRTFWVCLGLHIGILTMTLQNQGSQPFSLRTTARQGNVCDSQFWSNIPHSSNFIVRTSIRRYLPQPRNPKAPVAHRFARREGHSLNTPTLRRCWKFGSPRRAQLTLPHQCFLMFEDFVWKVGFDFLNQLADTFFVEVLILPHVM